MYSELQKKIKPDTDFNVIPDAQKRERGYNAQRKLAAWIGGSIFGSLSTYKQIQVSKQEWEECHESVIHRKSL